MTTEILVQVTPQELRIPLSGLDAWQDAELELVREPRAILIRRKSTQPVPQHTLHTVLRDPGALYETDTEIITRMTPKGLEIPISALGEWHDAELEMVREKTAIIIRPKLVILSERERVQQMLREAGLLYETHWEPGPIVSPEELARIAEKLAQGPPLSELIIAEREDRI